MSLYFFRDKGPDGYLSNFFKTTFQKDGVIFNCSEQAFMFAKCKVFDPNNSTMLENILNETDPKKVKKLGRRVKNFDDQKWNHIKYSIMVEILHCKFNSNEEIKNALLRTKGTQLYEASPYDKIWGIGYGKSTAAKTDPDSFGENLLGKALMEVRDSL